MHVLDARAAPAVDRLIVVADHEHLTGRAGEHANPRVLQGVGVLELVDQQMPEPFAIMLEQRIVVQPQLVRAQQQLGEIDQSRTLACGLVRAIDVDQRRVDRVVAWIERIRPLALVLRAVDEPGRLARRKSRLVQTKTLDRALDQALLIVRVENLEGLGQPRLAPVPAQKPMRDAVERADRKAAHVVRDQRLGARAHFAGGLVGEGDGEHRPRRHAIDFEQPADAMREYARLAGTGAGQHQIMSGRRRHGFALRGIQSIEKMRDIHGESVAAPTRFVQKVGPSETWRAFKHHRLPCSHSSQRSCFRPRPRPLRRTRPRRITRCITTPAPKCSRSACVCRERQLMSTSPRMTMGRAMSTSCRANAHRRPRARATAGRPAIGAPASV